MRADIHQIAVVITVLLSLGCSTLAAEDDRRHSRRYRGELQILIADDFTGQGADIHYHLISAADSDILQLIFPNGRPDTVLTSGMQIEIQGQRRNGRLNVESLRVLGPSTPRH